MHTTTVSLADAIGEARDRIDDAREAYRELHEFATEEYGDVEAAPDVVYERLQRYDEAAKQAERRIHVVEQTLDHWGGPEQEDGVWTGDDFTIEMMSGIQAAQIEDRIGASRQAMRQEKGVLPNEMSGERVTEILTECVVDEPDGIPNSTDAPTLSEYPEPVMLWLVEQVNTFNSAGDPNFEPEGLGDVTATTSSDSST